MKPLHHQQHQHRPSPSPQPPQLLLQKHNPTSTITATAPSKSKSKPKPKSKPTNGNTNETEQLGTDGRPLIPMSKTARDKERKKKSKARIVIEHVDLIKDEFWERRPWILRGTAG
jgi:tRNA(His) guanylyltransferase